MEQLILKAAPLSLDVQDLRVKLMHAYIVRTYASILREIIPSRRHGIHVCSAAVILIRPSLLQLIGQKIDWKRQSVSAQKYPICHVYCERHIYLRTYVHGMANVSQYM